MDVHQVIIIGAGISALGASLELSKHSIEHIIIEARDRIGGRITSKIFDDVQVQLGASYIHRPHANNRIAGIMKEKNWNGKLSNLNEKMAFYLQKESQQKSETMREISLALGQQQFSYIQKVGQCLTIDISIEEASKQLILSAEKERSQLVNIMKWWLILWGNMAGTEPSEKSAKECQLFESEQDMLPEKGYSNLFKEVFKGVTAEVKLNQKVLKIDYRQDIIQIQTQDSVFRARKVISSLPLGVLQNNTVQFRPRIPKSHQDILKKIGNGNANKIFVSFEKPFWNVSQAWLFFITQDEYNKYPVAAPILQGSRYILCFFISGRTNDLISNFSDAEIQEDIVAFLRKFNFKEQIKVRGLEVTKWHKDPLSQGSYSFFRVGLSYLNVDYLREPIDNKIWFVGQHCRPQDISCSHAAFETGVWAAQQIAKGHE